MIAHHDIDRAHNFSYEISDNTQNKERKNMDKPRGRQLEPHSIVNSDSISTTSSKSPNPLLARPPEIVKNIQKASQTNTTLDKNLLKPKMDYYHIQHQPRSNENPRSTSVDSTADVRTLYSTRSSTTSLNTKPSRQSRFKHPLSTYNNEAVETIIPSHSTILYQKNAKQKLSSESSTTDVELHFPSSYPQPQRTHRKSVAMGSDIVPAFDDMMLEFDDDNRYPIKDVDNKFKKQKDVTHDDSSSSLSSISSTSSTSVPNVHDGNIGRIQQRINQLKVRSETETSDESNNVFTNIEQKVLFETINNDLFNLRRYNQKPIFDSLKRLNAKIENNTLLNPIKSQNRNKTIRPPKQIDIKPSTSPLSNKEIKHRMKLILKNSSAQLNNLWEDFEDRSSKGSDLSSMSNGQYKLKNKLYVIKENSIFHNESDILKQQLDEFELGVGLTHQKTSLSSDPSPRT